MRPASGMTEDAFREQIHRVEGVLMHRPVMNFDARATVLVGQSPRILRDEVTGTLHLEVWSLHAGRQMDVERAGPFRNRQAHPLHYPARELAGRHA